ncbi:MAG: CoA-binding protein [Dehalococcoidales bacterium]|nr:MAG: CoA-binding protein [Dehalococcoidales bacterium]
MPEPHELDTMFYPDSVAVVGASANPLSWGGTSFLSRLQKLEFPGELYPVNPRDTEILGLKAYPSVRSIPNPPDLAIIAIPASAVPQVLKDCVANGVKNVHIFSSGFAETGLEEGRRLDEEITAIIQKGGLRVVGPNCMGLYIPKSKLAYWGAEPTGSGPVAFLSQSGGHAEMLSEYAQDLGVYFSKVISFGNARGLQAVDFLEYLAQDPETSIITMYLEGIREGNRFVQLIKSINRTKPVIIWKGGLTESGSRAVASHTGSLAGEERMWDAFFTQTGAVRVNSLQEIVDVVMAFLYLQPPRGRRTLLIGGGGGNSVAMADICNQEGLEVPHLAEETRQQLNTFISLAGNSARNPVDAWMLQNNVDLFRRALELSVADPVIDLVILDKYIWGEDDDEGPGNSQEAEKVGDFIIDFAKNNRFGKPVVLALNGRLNAPDSATSTAELWRKFALAGVPTYISQQSASRALSSFIGYHQFQQKHAGDL